MKKRAHRRSLVDTHDLAHNGILSFRSVASLPLSGASHPTGPTLLGGLGGVHVGVLVLAFVFAILSVNEDKQHVFESLEKEPPCSCKTRSLAVLSSPLGFSDLSLRLKDLCVFCSRAGGIMLKVRDSSVVTRVPGFVKVFPGVKCIGNESAW